MKKLTYFLKFNLIYFVIAVLLFVIEVCIALFIQDSFIRPYFGDVLVVILIYCFVRSLVNSPIIKTALAVLAFSFLIEILQYFHFVNIIGLGNYKLANIVLGTDFALADLLAYMAGIIIVLAGERLCKNI